MQRERALDIVKALAAGVDPETGEIFPADSAYQRPDVIRALFEAWSALAGARDRESRRRAGRPVGRAA